MKKRILGILSILGMLLIGVLLLTSPFGRELRVDLDSAGYIIFGIVGIVFGLVFHIR